MDTETLHEAVIEHRILTVEESAACLSELRGKHRTVIAKRKEGGHE